MEQWGHIAYSLTIREENKYTHCPGWLRGLSLTTNFHLEVVGPHATQVGGDKWLMFPTEGFRCHRKWISGLWSCLHKKQPLMWTANLQPAGNLAPAAGKMVAPQQTGQAALPQWPRELGLLPGRWRTKAPRRSSRPFLLSHTL